MMNVRGVIGICVLSLAACSVAWAASDAPAETHQNQWELGPEVYYFHYREPAIDVTFKGPMYGLAGAFTHHHPNRLMLKAEGRGAAGLVDYRGSGTIHDITDYTLEGRLAAGYDVPVGDTQRLTPFVGIGYRYLNDDSSGRRSSTGAVGYDRESNYLYSPIGLEFHTPMGNQWQVGLTAEYDLFWRGWQRSHLEDASPAFNTVSNTQTRGYGLRGAIHLVKTGERVDWAIEPFVRWWRIQDSKSANVTFSGVIVGTGYEPKNETLEVGGNVTVRF